jgi:NADH dehydrogenase FAD-containing subunit
LSEAAKRISLYYKPEEINFNLNLVVGAVKARTLDWIEESELLKDENGFILVNDSLQSISHPDVFAVGDIATMKNYPSSKSGRVCS